MLKQALLILALSTLTPLCFGQAKTHPFVKGPEGLNITEFSKQDITPTVASMGVGLDGAVYAGVDGTGSLGKGPGKGKIVKLIDSDNDGIADSHTVFAMVDNPRGILAIGKHVWVLHATWINNRELKGMYLTLFEDSDGDGVADGPGKILIKDFGTKKYNQNRGISHHQRHPHGYRWLDLRGDRGLRLRECDRYRRTLTHDVRRRSRPRTPGRYRDGRILLRTA